MSEFAEVLDGVGPRLRALRVARGMTLTEVADATGIPRPPRARRAAGARTPPLARLPPPARCSPAPLDVLVDAPPTGDPRVRMPAVQRGGMTFVPLTRRPGGLQAYKLIMPAGYPGRTPELKTHEGYEWAYVLSGHVRRRLGEDDTVLRPGEVVEFDTHVPHAFANPGTEPAEMLTLFGPQGERAHVRTRSS